MADDNASNDRPKTFLGYGLSEYRKRDMLQMLAFLGQRGFSKYRKSQLIDRLIEIYHDGLTMSFEQETALKAWLRNLRVGPISDHYLPQGEQPSPAQRPREKKRKRVDQSLQERSGNVRIKREEPLAGTIKRGQSPAPKLEVKECSICVEELMITEFPHRIGARCMHDPTCCRRCLSQAIGMQIEHKEWDQITCAECEATLSFDEVKSSASENDFLRYDKKSLLSFISNDPNFNNCLGPNCDDGQIHEDGDDQPIMTCGSCGFKTCFTHKRPWHSGLTCGEYDIQEAKRLRQEEESQTLMEKDTMRCPSCQARIQKISGCDHMTCKCGTEFCFACGVDYRVLRGYNEGHEPTCPHHSENLPRHPHQAPAPNQIAAPQRIMPDPAGPMGRSLLDIDRWFE